MARLLTLGSLAAIAAVSNGEIDQLMQDPLVQFGTDGRRLLGHSFMPEQRQAQNDYTEETVRYRTIMANAATRYSKPQYKGGELLGTVKVSLFNFDVGRAIKGRDLDDLKRVLRKNQSAPALAAFANLVDRFILRALVDADEFTIWQAVVHGKAKLRGNDGYSEDVDYPNPDGHRVTAGGDWTDPAYDPFLDILAGGQVFRRKGLKGKRAFAPAPVVNTLCSHPAMIARTLGLSASVATAIAGGAVASTAIDLGTLNALFVRNGLPPIEQYDEMARTEDGLVPFLDADAFVMTAATDNTLNVESGDGRVVEVVTDAIGYVGLGIPHNREVAGRAYTVDYDEHKGGGVDLTGWNSTAPVITEPEAVFAITGIRTGA